MSNNQPIEMTGEEFAKFMDKQSDDSTKLSILTAKVREFITAWKKFDVSMVFLASELEEIVANAPAR